MCDRRGLSRSIALVALAAALAWSPPALAFETEAEARGAPSKEFVYHTVERGETIWAIADRYGSTAASVIRENAIEDPGKIWVGTRLRIPFPSVTAQPVTSATFARLPCPPVKVTVA